ncbi:MAG: 2-hydroxyacid dehydrogenase [bacterium]
MTLLIHAPPSFRPELYRELIAKQAPDIAVRMRNEAGAPEDIVFAAGWNPPDGFWHQFPNLRGITSLGAGVDSLLRDQDIPPNLPIARLVDGQMARMMAEYVVLAVLSHRRGGREHVRDPAGAGGGVSLARPGNQVLILGLGHLGTSVAQALQPLGFQVSGWVRTPRESPLPEVRLHHGRTGLQEALPHADYLVSLLPLTPETQNLLDHKLLRQAKPGAYLINTGRGQTVVEQDLLDALDSGLLNGACLDVFQTEPLPPEHPFLAHPRVMVTPHISSVTPPDSVVPQIIENYRRARAGEPLLNLIDRARGY